MYDKFIDGLAPTIEGPASRAETVTPSDSVDLADVSRALYVGATGDLSVIMEHGGTVTFRNVVGGTIMPIRVSRVLDAETTAFEIVALR